MCKTQQKESRELQMRTRMASSWVLKDQIRDDCNEMRKAKGRTSIWVTCKECWANPSIQEEVIKETEDSLDLNNGRLLRLERRISVARMGWQRWERKHQGRVKRSKTRIPIRSQRLPRQLLVQHRYSQKKMVQWSIKKIKISVEASIPSRKSELRCLSFSSQSRSVMLMACVPAMMDTTTLLWQSRQRTGLGSLHAWRSTGT